MVLRYSEISIVTMVFKLDIGLRGVYSVIRHTRHRERNVMSTMVSARIEDELYTQATDIMKQISVTPTQLISSAYQFMVRERCLPGAQEPAKSSPKLNDAQMQELQEFFSTAMFEIDVFKDMDIGADGTEYDELLGAALKDDYESIR